MIKKMLAIPILCISMVFFVQCSKDLSNPETDNYSIKKGPGGGGGGGGETETAGNNLSFPVFALDGFTITPVTNMTYTTEYIGPYTGLTDAEIEYLEANGPWYAQKVDGNVWQADFINANNDQYVSFIDWGDVIEAVNPKIGRPFRVEVTLYTDISENQMTGFTMAVLANPSSPNETQGTNISTYEGNWATIISGSPKLIIQPLESGAVPLWDDELGMWTGTGVQNPISGFSFGPELNVGGKYIYGASSGGWKPTAAGIYRLTFFMPGNTSFIHLENAVIANYIGNDAYGEPETTASSPVVDATNNLTYVDVKVTTGGGGSGKGR